MSEKPVRIEISYEGRHMRVDDGIRPIDSWTATILFSGPLRLRATITRWLNDRYRHRGWLTFEQTRDAALAFCKPFDFLLPREEGNSMRYEWVETYRMMGNPDYGKEDQIRYATYERKDKP